MGETINNFLHILRQTTGTDRWCNGDCFALYRLLKLFHPDAEPWYDQIEGHVYTKIDGEFYDIYGKHTSLPNEPIHMHLEPRILEQAFEWRFEK